jgi:hypothetical protein
MLRKRNSFSLDRGRDLGRVADEPPPVWRTSSAFSTPADFRFSRVASSRSWCSG